MIKFTGHFSGSSGNLYTLDLDGRRILLECGVSWKLLLNTINLLNYSACLVTHEHKDHARCIDRVSKYIDTYCSTGTFTELEENIFVEDVKLVESMKCIYIGDEIAVMPFATFHNAKEPLGFLIKYKDYRILFAIDTSELPYTFKDLTHIFIEANYSKPFLDDRFNRGMYHMEINDTLEFIKENMSEKLQEVKLLHISKKFGDEEIFNDRLNELLKGESHETMEESIYITKFKEKYNKF